MRHYGDDAYKVGASAVDDLIVAGYITAPMVSRPARMEFIGGAVAGLVYDIAYGKSPEPRSERNASKVGSGGTSSGPTPTWEGMRHSPRNYNEIADLYLEPRNYSCPKGWRPAVRNGRMVCIRR